MGTAQSQRPPEHRAYGLIQEAGGTGKEPGSVEEERRCIGVESECAGGRECHVHRAASNRNHLGSNASLSPLFPFLKDEKKLFPRGADLFSLTRGGK